MALEVVGRMKPPVRDDAVLAAAVALRPATVLVLAEPLEAELAMLVLLDVLLCNRLRAGVF